jgi:VacB/RNase II family 3'-5' exoribonuclease
MDDSVRTQHREMLINIARKAMIDRGLITDFSQQILSDVERIQENAVPYDNSIRDLRALPWCSIDNDSSLDLDQLTAAQVLPDGAVRIYVAISDVDNIAKKGSAIDIHASENTLTVYTPAIIFPMLPERLSTDLTSLGFNSERQSIVTELLLDAEGNITTEDVYGALVVNKAKLAYDSTAAWLDGLSPIPGEIAAVPDLDDNIRLQDAAAKKFKILRHDNGALDFDTVESHAVFEGDTIKAIKTEKKNRAKELIEEFMIAVNGATARFLESKRFPSIRRVVRKPKNWDRIVTLAREKNFGLPEQPDSKALDNFLISQKQKDPDRYHELSLSVIKLMGPGEYTLELPGEIPEGHFGLAVQDYTHSTAPNRRYPDLITQRLLKNAVLGVTTPYSNDELKAFAEHCTQKENDAKKVERLVEKSAAAILLSEMIGTRFDAIVTGAAEKGTWVRITEPYVEGRLTGDVRGIEVGHKLKVELISTDIEKGFIDFKKAAVI